MRKTALFIIFLLITLSGIRAQPGQSSPLLSLNEKNTPLSSVLDRISEQTGMEFSYNPLLINPEISISINLRKTSIQKTLEILGKKINAEFSIVEDLIVITPTEEPLIKPPSNFTLNGFISDKTSGETLIGASVSISGTSTGTITNAFGFYSLQLKPGKHDLIFAYIGYENDTLNVSLSKDQKMDRNLAVASIDLPDIIVDIPLASKLDDKQPGELKFSPTDLSNMPEFGGESGLVKGLQSLPGLSMHSDGSAFFYVRGGDRDQNLIIIDDAPIYNPSHLFGFYSLVIPDFAKSIDIYKSDMPTNLGDRLSSIISIRTKDGNLNKFHFSGAINPLVYRFSMETPIVKKKGSIFLSFRRSNFEWIYKQSAPDTKLNFGDLNFKWNHKLNDKNRLYLTAIWSSDNYTNQPENSSGKSGIQWQNFAATLRWNHIFGSKLFSNTTLYTGNYAYRLSFTPDFWQSGLGTLSLKTDFTHYTNPGVTSRFGVEALSYFINPGEVSFGTSLNLFPDFSPNYSRKLVAYYHGTFDLNEKFQLKAGFRLTNWGNTGPDTYYTFDEQHEVADTFNAGKGVYHNYTNLAPRLSLQFQLDKYSRMKLSYGVYHQYLQLISNSNSPFTSLEVWLGSGPNIKPQSSDQVALSYLRYFEKAGMELSLEAYYKRFNNQIDYEPHAVTLINPLLEGELRFGKMRSLGLEVFLKKNFGRINGWVAYTYSRALRNTPEVNSGRDYYAFQDRPHEFSIMLNYALGKRVFFSGYWTIFSGARFSSPTGFYMFNDQQVPIYDEKNNDRLPVYNRLDIAFKFVLNKKEDARYQNSLTFSIYNALAHKNIYQVNFSKIPREGDRPIIPANHLANKSLIASQGDLIRFLPSLTYKFKL